MQVTVREQPPADFSPKDKAARFQIVGAEGALRPGAKGELEQLFRDASAQYMKRQANVQDQFTASQAG